MTHKTIVWVILTYLRFRNALTKGVFPKWSMLSPKTPLTVTFGHDCQHLLAETLAKAVGAHHRYLEVSFPNGPCSHPRYHCKSRSARIVNIC